MAEKYNVPSNVKVFKKRPPASTIEGRENQLIALAIDRAEEQLRNGTAAAQVITHYLRLGSTKDRIEKEILEKKKELVVAQTEALHSAKKVEELYMNALKAMRTYNSGEAYNSEDVKSKE